ncbi:MAG: ketoacyl-ACP synthase III, partial [Bacteroidales bacterium]|nr:ketoacyl-ACP synthase III [Bacteroidales bacterium]
MNTEIQYIEYYLPLKIVTNIDILNEFPNWNKDNFEKKVGVKSRHIAETNETALDLAIEASKKVLQNFDKKKIDFVLLCTQSPDYFLPTSACILQDKLGLEKTSGALDFNLGCSGYIYGLSIAKGLIASESANNILLVMAETYSKHIHPKDRVNRTIFGDGAAATIITKSEIEGIGKFVFGTDGSGFDKLIVRNGAFKYQKTLNELEYKYRNENYTSNNCLYMDGPEIFNFTIEKIPGVVQAVLKINNLSADSIDYFIFHQANKFILNYLRKKIGIAKEKFYINLEETGNTVSVT